MNKTLVKRGQVAFVFICRTKKDNVRIAKKISLSNLKIFYSMKI